MARKGQVEPGSWHYRARQMVAEVLATLPADMGYQERKKALSAAYPWGERAMLPYKAWQAESRRALEPWAPKPRIPRLRLTNANRLHCGWCSGRGPEAVCLICAHAKAEEKTAVTDPEALTLMTNATMDDRLVVADHLSEKGWEALAAVWRK